MKGTHVLWRSPQGDGRLALEIRQAPSDLRLLPALVESILDGQHYVAFVFLRVEDVVSLDLGAIAATTETLQRLKSGRLCLAGRREILTRIAGSDLNSEQIGLMLDDVDADTPLSEFLWDRLEAVRFKSEFVRHARGHVRKGCALEAMLSLCHEIGLCTLGLDTISTRTGLTQRTQFDYVHAIADRASMARAQTHDLASGAAHRVARWSS